MSESFSDSRNIDPALLNMDPAMAYLHCMRNHANPPQPSDENSAQDPPATPLTSATANARGTGMLLVAFGQLVKRRANLKDQSAIALDQFCENSSADECQVMLYAHLLEVHDALKRNEKVNEWKIMHGSRV
ncbi:hypothetical protein B0H10DRAFT_2212506 [Mycena sp. CBHHK59/15]|nr:hypothetical protein B0H10DRAFT_2212506 [Mycena sp. CBHHK59/15]